MTMLVIPITKNMYAYERKEKLVLTIFSRFLQEMSGNELKMVFQVVFVLLTENMSI